MIVSVYCIKREGDSSVIADARIAYLKPGSGWETVRVLKDKRIELSKCMMIWTDSTYPATEIAWFRYSRDSGLSDLY